LNNFQGEGLRRFLTAHAADVVECAIDDPGVLSDLDTPQDYERATAATKADR
jgi:CTP:molybdopterin cytidylyltransferase MocA